MSGEMLMQIVPDADNLVVTAMVAPQDINHVSVGQDAALVIGAFDQKVVPRLDGMVSFVSPDLKTDERTGMALYEVRIALGDSAVTELAERDLALLPGMPAEVYISTSDRTVAEYLAEPLAKQMRTTFRES
ncbi:MAG: HlyD family efflux transporter periplasmic adaptor subunit [Sedimentitalea sp.]|uniref:HlyD family efflux transporter periplasmic adaptor subunit n=1 Tax=Sedimentitalea sp. TaxID=2048915 RepID=UPI0032633878